ncbi:MAG: leucine-rich repeat domain-containing protein [Firmicutes bacterium]|nr:leucine-rich repeat domain-containing protein [Bacillota bacterium]
MQIGEENSDSTVIDNTVQSIVIPGSVDVIAGWAFCGCEGLNEVTIEEGLERIDSGAFRLCKGLEEITIPGSVKSIGSEAFSESGITKITIPSGVKRIYAGAFSDCGSLTDVILSDGVEIIDSSAFRRCGELTELVIPNSVREMGLDVFSGCKIKSLTLPDSLVKYDGSVELHDCAITFKGVIYTSDTYDDLYTAVNGHPYEIPSGIPPAA